MLAVGVCAAWAVARLRSADLAPIPTRTLRWLRGAYLVALGCFAGVLLPALSALGLDLGVLIAFALMVGGYALAWLAMLVGRPQLLVPAFLRRELERRGAAVTDAAGQPIAESGRPAVVVRVVQENLAHVEAAYASGDQIQFDEALTSAAGSTPPAALLRVIEDDEQREELSWALVHVAERASSVVYAKALMESLPEVRRKSPRWSVVLLGRVVNDEPTLAAFLDEVGQASETHLNAVLATASDLTSWDATHFGPGCARILSATG